MKQVERKHRLALTLLFAGVVFCFFITTIMVVGGVIIYLINKGVLEPSLDVPRSHHLILNIMATSIRIGTVLTVIASNLPLRPVNTIINAMNRLASGDYKTRLYFGRLLSRHPTAIEISDSFNNLAEELDKTEILRSDFINNFSHEFKTPIVSIAGFAKLLKYGDLTEEQKADYIDIIEEESMRLSALATNILNLTRVENQTILTGVTEFNLSEQIRNCFLLLESKWTKKNITPEIDFGEYFINANEELMKQVWINLIDNAIKFGEEGTPVRVDITETIDHIFVSITNTGLEIPPELRDKIFRKFYQADESHSSEGNGVGLAVVKKVIKLHNGDITVSSGNHKTVFTVSLPK